MENKWDGGERRRTDDKNWDKLIDYMGESREFRKNLEAKISSIEEQTKKTNGRVDRLEDLRQEIETKIQDRKDASENWQGKLSVGAAIVSALAMLWAIFKK